MNDYDEGPMNEWPDRFPIITVYTMPMEHLLLLMQMFSIFVAMTSNILVFDSGFLADVDLSPLERPEDLRAAKFKNISSDTKGIKVSRFMMRRGITMDSGAGDNVIPKRMVNHKKIRRSPGQDAGLHYVVAGDHRIPNLGEVDLKFTTTEGVEESWCCQIADVNKPLGSVADRVDHGYRVVYDRDDDTGQDLS